MTGEDFDEAPLDLLEDDGDGVIEMGLVFDDDEKKNETGKKPPGKSGCCVLLLGVGTSLLMAGWGIAEWMS